MVRQLLHGVAVHDLEGLGIYDAHGTVYDIWHVDPLGDALEILPDLGRHRARVDVLHRGLPTRLVDLGRGFGPLDPGLFLWGSCGLLLDREGFRLLLRDGSLAALGSLYGVSGGTTDQEPNGTGCNNKSEQMLVDKTPHLLKSITLSPVSCVSIHRLFAAYLAFVWHLRPLRKI